MEFDLDLRDGEPPGPLFDTLQCIDECKAGDVIRLRIHREPLMLYPHLQAMNIPWTIERFGSPDWQLCIGPMPEDHGKH